VNTIDRTSVPVGRPVTETPTVDPPGYTHPEWQSRFPWLVQGTTGRGSDSDLFDLGLFAAASSARDVLEHWEELKKASGLSMVVHARQTHGAKVRGHNIGPASLRIVPDCDGHVTADPNVLLAVTTADCVPVSLVDPRRGAIGLLHAGWRGVAFGILERGIEALAGGSSAREDLHVHFGPAICGACYEVGPEVFVALGLPAPSGPEPVDLRAVMAVRAHAAGVPSEQITHSTHCTLCGDSRLFSHRAGDGGRQVGYLGIRP
jgi:YfiH family protein